jgi:hypothetical protein
MHICDYGCGQEATYQLKNGKWSCVEWWGNCPAFKKVRDTWVVSEETKKKQSISLKGKNTWSKGKPLSKEHRKKMSGKIPWNKGKTGIYSEETLKKISAGARNGPLPMLGKKHTEEAKKKMSIASKLTIKQIQKKYPTFSKLEEMRYEPGKEKEKVIQVHCKNNKCKNSKEKGGWFTPIRDNIFGRAIAIETYKGNDMNFIYCSEFCKAECPLYNMNGDPNRSKQLPYTQEEYKIFRITVLERENYICEYCENSATKVHHSRPQKLEPGFALDPDFGVACCDVCHYKYGHKTGTECSTGNLANKIC